jgi:hypothetical protein
MKTALPGLFLALAAMVAMGAQLPESTSQPPTTGSVLALTSTTGSSTGPTTQGLRRAFPLPTDLAILTQRSIFIKGYQRVDDTMPLLPGTTLPVIAGTEQSLIFNGATDADGQFQAFLEDSASGQVAIVHVGQTIAEGIVSGISLHALSYAAHGRVVEVAIGHNLEGGVSPLSATRPIEVGPTSAPAGMDDIIRRLKAKHDSGQ